MESNEGLSLLYISGDPRVLPLVTEVTLIPSWDATCLERGLDHRAARIFIRNILILFPAC